MNSISVLGIDPGYDRVGWCCAMITSRQCTVLESGCIKTDDNLSPIERFAQIDAELSSIIRKFLPTECAIESLFFAKNTKTAMRVSEARGVIISCLFRNSISVFEYTPLQIKLALTGNGRANKKEVNKMLDILRGSEKKKGVLVLTKSETLPKLDDEIDAIATMLCHQSMRALRSI